MEEKSKVILVLNIKLDKDRSDELEVREDDEPEDVAEIFCKKHKLPLHVKQVLTRKIEDNLDEYIKEEIANNTTLLTSVVSGIKATNTSVSHYRSASTKNYGELLYDKGIMMKQKVEHMIQLKKQSILEKEMQNSTFTPKINPYTHKPRNQSAKSSKTRNCNNLENTIYTFKPSINKPRLKRKETEKKDKCLELYNNAKLIKQKKEENSQKIFNEIHTFKPDISKTFRANSPVSKSSNFSFIKKVKIQQNKTMFNLLNPNSNGCITKSTVQSISLPREVHDKIGRIIYELIELDEELNFEEFCKAVEILEQETQNLQNEQERYLVPNEFT